jgi:hypothetical protein
VVGVGYGGYKLMDTVNGPGSYSMGGYYSLDLTSGLSGHIGDSHWHRFNPDSQGRFDEYLKE